MKPQCFKLWDIKIDTWITSDLSEYVSIAEYVSGSFMSQGFVDVKPRYVDAVEIVWPDENGIYNEPEI